MDVRRIGGQYCPTLEQDCSEHSLETSGGREKDMKVEEEKELKEEEEEEEEEGCADIRPTATKPALVRRRFEYVNITFDQLTPSRGRRTGNV